MFYECSYLQNTTSKMSTNASFKKADHTVLKHIPEPERNVSTGNSMRLNHTNFEKTGTITCPDRKMFNRQKV